MSESEDDVPLGKKIMKAEEESGGKDAGGDSDDDAPLGGRKGKVKKEKAEKAEEEDEDDQPLGKRKITPVKKEKTTPVKKEKVEKPSAKKAGKKKRAETPPEEDEEEDEEDKPVLKKAKTASAKKATAKKSAAKKGAKEAPAAKGKKSKGKKGADEDDAEGQLAVVKVKREKKPDEIVYEWWKQEDPLPEGKKWRFLEHNGVIFPTPYEAHGVKMKYDGEDITLDDRQESIATMYAAMARTEYVSKKTFLNNFWREFSEALGKNTVVKDLKKCDFSPIQSYLDAEREKKKLLTSEDKKKMKAQTDKINEPYATIVLDTHTEKNGNYRVEPAGLFRGRGEHPKMGNVKAVIEPENITMNCSSDACPPRCPLPGHSWSSCVHKDETTWLAFYKDTINGEFKYIFLSAGSSLKGQSDRDKFEKARELKKCVKKIREQVTTGLKSKDDEIMQKNTAVWIIDNLAIRAGNEKNTAEEADTVGCCSLRIEHITLDADQDGKTIYFNFPGKDSIEYKNTLKIRPKDDKIRESRGEEDADVSFVRAGEEDNFLQIWKNMKALVERKSAKPEDDVFHDLDTGKLNAYLGSLMKGLSAKVFRTYNASITLDQELNKLEEHPNRVNIMKNDALMTKFYNDANYQVAVLCNHSRTVGAAHGVSMELLKTKGADIEAEIAELKKGLKGSNADDKAKAKKKIATLEEKLHKHEIGMGQKQKLSGVALGTSKVNYLDPRITVGWCKKYGDFTLSKVMNKSLTTKFKWAIEEATEDFRF